MTPSARCCKFPTPPEAITGTDMESLTREVRSRSNPFLVPSRSILVSRISPAPKSAIFLAHPIASIPVGLRPPWVNISQRECSPHSTCLASMATTMHWLPNLLAASLTKSGLKIAAEFMATLSAPALSKLRISAISRTPPPTVSGMKTSPAILSTVSKVVSRPSWLAVISRNVISSAPCSL